MFEQTKEQRSAQEILERRKLRSDLISWARYISKKRWDQEPAKHHLILLEKLQAVSDGILLHSKTGKPCSRLMVLMPPSSAKSRYTSVIAPPWFMQRRKACNILACSHSADLIETFSRQCRNIVESEELVLGYRLAEDSRAIKEWSTDGLGSYYCSGVGAGLSGRRADYAIIDDYIGLEEDADSKLIRDKQWAWYHADFSPRIKPGGVRIIVANRRHEDDLVGRLLACEADDWEVIKLPYFAEEGDPLGRAVGSRLWPEYFNEETDREVLSKPARTQAGLYQQRPAPEEGDFFKKDWLVTYTRDEYDALMRLEPRIYGAGDWAVSESKDANRSCFGGAALTPDGLLYILPDIFWKTSGPKETVDAFIQFLKRRSPMNFWSEKGHISKAWGPFLQERMREEEVYSVITEVTPSKAKDIRARAIQGRMSMLRVRFPGFAPWWEAAMHELLSFPGGKADDFVDFIAHLGMGINGMVKTSPAAKNEAELFNGAAKPLNFRWLKDSDAEEKRKKLVKYLGR